MALWRLALLAFPLGVFLLSLYAYPESDGREILEVVGVEEGKPRFAEAVVVASSQRGELVARGKVIAVEKRSGRVAEVRLIGERELTVFISRALIEDKDIMGKNVTIHGIYVKSGKALGRVIIVEDDASCIAKKRFEEKCEELARRRR